MSKQNLIGKKIDPTIFVNGISIIEGILKDKNIKRKSLSVALGAMKQSMIKGNLVELGYYLCLLAHVFPKVKDIYFKRDSDSYSMIQALLRIMSQYNIPGTKAELKLLLKNNEIKLKD